MTLNTIHNRLFLLAMILIPFNALPYFRNVFGELSVEGAFYPFIFIVIIFIINTLIRLRLKLPITKGGYWGLLFVAISFESSLYNANNIFESSFKGRTGIEKLLFQSMVLFFVILTVLSCYHFFMRHEGLSYVRRGVLMSLFIPLVIGVLELLSILVNSGAAQTLLTAINSLIRDSTISNYPRVRTVCGEASWFAMYAAFVFPWLLVEHAASRRGIRRNLSRLTIILLLVLVIFSQSRSAYVIIAFELFLYWWLSSRKKGLRNGVKVAIILVIGAVIITHADVAGKSILTTFASLSDVEENMSNIGRYGSMIAALDIARDHWNGVGLGQFGFYAPRYYPEFSRISPEIVFWSDNTSDTPWPPTLSLYFRILSETGWLALLAWLAVWGSAIRGVWKLYCATDQKDSKTRNDLAGLFACIAGLMMDGFNADSFRFFPYWIILALCWSLARRSQVNAVQCA